jgi:hypothetical protein
VIEARLRAQLTDASRGACLLADLCEQAGSSFANKSYGADDAMNTREHNWRRIGLVVATVLVAGVLVVVIVVGLFGRGRPVVKFQAGDRNVIAGETRRWTFDADATGGLPSGMEVFSGDWEVRAEPDAPTPPNALCQSGTAPFPALALSEKVYTDVVVSIRFKPISGREDQAAGILFRVQDKDNYYILRANALEDNVNLYIYASGKRSRIKGSSVKVPSGEWQVLRVEVAGDHFRGFLNDQPVVEASDDSYPAGRVGLWTKADSVTCFDNVHVTAK